jgi:23S rRNA (adenine2030-N6)-methyltransferase
VNYRHHFHAGNFADLLKHGLVLQLMQRLMADTSPLAVLDTHAGAGVYDIEGEAARRSGEAAKGIVRLMQAADAPAAFDPLKQAVRRLNPKGGERLYPGSPPLVVDVLRPGDSYLGCELRPDDYADLDRFLRGRKFGKALMRDGYEVLAEEAGRGPRRLVLVDPPFERGDDYVRTAEGVGRADGRPGDAFVIWTPLKDLETFDAFLGRLIDAGAESGLVVEARLKPLDDPLRMNGCALVILADPGVTMSMFAPARAIADWIVTRLGEPGGEARVEPLD